ncbi:MAG: hypothetical protein K6T16_02265 [Candidatus Pacearchaeota archaeon]|nr:hypothetical protein [Candidatus Pacearchaeota archaeon]
MNLIKDIMKPRREILEGKFQGVIQSHKADSEELRLESNAEDLFKVTYVSSALKRVLERVNEKLTGVSNQGAILLIGPYGAGKTHGLITLYHLLKEPQIAKSWLRNWKIDIALPPSTKTCIVSTRRYDVDFLWEPIFSKLGREDILRKIKRFPTVDQIEAVVGDETFAIFIDEIENWYGSFDPEKQADLIERNETFLEHLFEVANDPNRKLLVFLTFLEEKEGLKRILNRTKPVRIDVSVTEDREKIILHRLFEDSDKKDLDKIEQIIQGYMEKYSEPIRIENPYKYKQRMTETYPFHPLLLETLTQVYEAATERQDIRGMMNVLADMIKDNYDKKDLLLICDLDENAFRGIDLRLVEKYNYDLERVKDISSGAPILRSILVFTLNDKTIGATESDVLLSVFRPTQGQTLNELIMDLENIYGKPHYLHKEGDFYLFKHDLNIFALMEKEKKNITDKDLKNKIAEITKKDVFENRVFIYGFETIPDDSKIKIIVSLESWGENDTLKNKLAEFYQGKNWQNTYIVVLPTIDSILSSYEVIEKTRRLLAGENLQGQVEDKERKIQKLVTEEREQIADKIKAYYGRIVKWVARGKELVPRLINVLPDISAIREKVGSDSSLVGDFILQEIKDKAEGIRLEFIINDFKKFRKFPQILDDEVVFSAIRNLHRDKRLVIQGDRGKWFIDEIPKSLEFGFVIFDPKYAPAEVIETGVSEIPEGEEKPEGKEPGEVRPPKVERREKKQLQLRGNSPRVILSQIEARTQEKDLFTEINIKYHFSKELSKQEIMKFVKQLPQEEAEIEGEVELWREHED